MHYIRYLQKSVAKDFLDRMVFIGGPRQVGKTTFAKSFLTSKAAYFSWDDLADRKIIQGHQFDQELKVIVLDEIHKYGRWRTLLKGLYDKRHEDLKFLVTGSARLDYFRKGGDSLFGRYHYHRMHPLTLPEISKKPNLSDSETLLQFGGFPEPFSKQDSTFLKRWQNERTAKVFQFDLRDLASLRDYSSLELLNSMLPERVGSLLSRTSLAEDLEKSPHTIEAWIQLLENIYACFRLSPFGSPRAKALKKQQKLFLWDWSVLSSRGARFENMVASHLLKYCHYHHDSLGEDMELRYLRDVDGHEIDFVVIKNKAPLFAVECKTGEGGLSKNIEYFKSRTRIPKFYQVHCGNRDYGSSNNGRVLPFWKFCLEEKLV